MEAFRKAFEAGKGMNVNLVTWDPWPHMERPLNDVRAELGLVVCCVLRRRARQHESDLEFQARVLGFTGTTGTVFSSTVNVMSPRALTPSMFA